MFDAANLDTIKGIGGTLTSHGAYSGVLERIEVKGETDTPDFSIDLAAQPVPLKTTFHAIVDGTNGDTRLERVEARLIETLIVAHGAVVRAKDVKGRRVALDVTIDEGRIEDLLKLAVKAGKPLMTGQVRMTTKFLLPAGDADVIDRLELDGRFSLNEARFSNVNVQEQINTLSQRGKGETAKGGPSVVSSLSGTFRMRKSTLTFADLSFAVPGRRRADCRHLRHEARVARFSRRPAPRRHARENDDRLEGCGRKTGAAVCSAGRVAVRSCRSRSPGRARSPNSGWMSAGRSVQASDPLVVRTFRSACRT